MSSTFVFEPSPAKIRRNSPTKLYVFGRTIPISLGYPFRVAWAAYAPPKLFALVAHSFSRNWVLIREYGCVSRCILHTCRKWRHWSYSWGCHIPRPSPLRSLSRQVENPPGRPLTLWYWDSIKKIINLERTHLGFSLLKSSCNRANTSTLTDGPAEGRKLVSIRLLTSDLRAGTQIKINCTAG